MERNAILLIVAILDDAQLRDYIAMAGQIGVSALVEVHSEAALLNAVAMTSSEAQSFFGNPMV